MTAAHERFAAIDEGRPSQVYPALARASPDLFGICVVGARGGVYGVGEADVEFTIMSVAKPFVFALVCATFGPEEVRRRVGVNATGLPFNSLTAIEQGDDGRTNPMVNSGCDRDDKPCTRATLWKSVGASSSMACRVLPGGDSRSTRMSIAPLRRRTTSTGASSTCWRAVERSPVTLPKPSTCTRARARCAVTARDLATMGATLGLGGVNPITGEQVVDEETCRYVLAVMTTAGLYETSGDWLYDVGLPGKSGIGGGIVTVAPGKGGLGTFSPPLDEAGNSVRGQLAARFLSRALGLDIFVSRPG